MRRFNKFHVLALSFIVGWSSSIFAQQSQEPTPKAVLNEIDDPEHLFVGKWVVSELIDCENYKTTEDLSTIDKLLNCMNANVNRMQGSRPTWSIIFDGKSYNVSFSGSWLCGDSDRCEVSQVKYNEDELTFTLTRTLKGRSRPDSIAQCYLHLDSHLNDKMEGKYERQYGNETEQGNLAAWRETSKSSPSSHVPSIREPNQPQPSNPQQLQRSQGGSPMPNTGQCLNDCMWRFNLTFPNCGKECGFIYGPGSSDRLHQCYQEANSCRRNAQQELDSCKQSCTGR